MHMLPAGLSNGLPKLPKSFSSGLGLGGSLGMRVSVSKQDLISILSEAPYEDFDTEPAKKTR